MGRQACLGVRCELFVEIADLRRTSLLGCITWIVGQENKRVIEEQACFGVWRELAVRKTDLLIQK